MPKGSLRPSKSEAKKSKNALTAKQSQSFSSLKKNFKEMVNFGNAIDDMRKYL